ncbi:MAG TPA: ABC transporter ATP-binding protein [Streptosporangiaceae bacterium]|nr:ABC transporter ATP-binding protein [Streptosporangiaceae bacterium]
MPPTPDRLLLRAVRRSGGWAVLLTVAATTGALAQILLPAVLGGSLDSMLGRAHARTPVPAGWSALSGLRGTAGWLTALAALVVVVVGCGAFSQLATGTTSASTTSWVRRLLAGHILAVGPRMTTRLPAGDLVSRVTSGAAEAGYAPAGLARSLATVITAVGAVGALVLIDPWLAAALAAGFPVLALVLRRFVVDTSDVVTRYQQAQGAIAARLLEALGGAATIAAAGTWEREAARVLVPLPQLRAHGEATWRIQGRISAQGTLLLPLLQVLVLAVGGLELAAGRVTPGELLAASQYAVLGAGAAGAIASLGQVARARAGARRAAGVLATAAPSYGTRSLPPGRGRVEFRGVSVWAGGTALLAGIDLVVPGGTALAVVGRPGSGKSVLTALAGRMTDPDEGEVLLDGVPLRSLAQADLRRAVQFAFARPGLLGATVGEAVSFGPQPVPPERVAAAARAACAEDFVRRLPEGWQTPLAQAPMSGGERQRLGLARAFAHAHTARVLVLDDATSSLDTVTEMQVSRSLTEGLGGLTRLIVAYRAATAARADLVAWLEAGRLRACAPHTHLWADPRYRALFQAADEGRVTVAAGAPA